MTLRETGPASSVGFRRRQQRRESANVFLGENPLIGALDLGQAQHAVWFADKKLEVIDRFMVPHSREGIERFLMKAETQRLSGGFERLVVFMEATSHFWENVANVLEQRGVAYRTVATLAVAREREITHLTYAKGDYRDAELIAGLGAKGQWLHRTLGCEPLWLELGTLAREHELLLELEIAEKNRIGAFLELAAPEFLAVFRDPMRKTARAVLRRITRPAADLPRTFAAVAERTRATDGRRLHHGKARAFAAALEAAPSYGVERLLAPTLARVGCALDRFEAFLDLRTDLRARLVALYEATPYRAVLDTIPGVAPESHALLLGFVGDPKQYDRATCLVKLAGTEPRENASGKGEGSHAIARRGRAALRWVVHRIVIALARNNDAFAAYLRRLVDRPDSPLKWPQAVVATGNKYLRLVHHLCVAGEPYDSSKLASHD